MDCRLPQGLPNTALKQLFKNSSHSLQEACIDHHHWIAVFYNDLDGRYTRELSWMQERGTEMKEIRGYRGDCRILWIRAGWELQSGNGRAFFAARQSKVVS